MKSIDDQLEQWVEGNPIHNKERDECTPDFSCCRGVEFMADKDVRERFAKAHEEGDEETTNSMLMMFLGAAFSGSKVHIAGDGPLGEPS